MVAEMIASNVPNQKPNRAPPDSENSTAPGTETAVARM